MTTYEPPEREPRKPKARAAAHDFARYRAHKKLDVERLGLMIEREEHAALQIMSTPITARGQVLSLAAAQHVATALQDKIAIDEARGSQRHRRVSGPAKLLTLLFLVVIDFPIMLWFAGSVFSVDWSNPFGFRLVISLTIAFCGTTGLAAVLHGVGRTLRKNKDHRRRLAWSAMSRRMKSSVIGDGLLVMLIAVVIFVRVYVEGMLVGQVGLALLLAGMTALVILASAMLRLSLAFRDGSPERDELIHYSARVHDALQRKRAYEDRADQLRRELVLLQRPPTHHSTFAVADTAARVEAASAGDEHPLDEAVIDRWLAAAYSKLVEELTELVLDLDAGLEDATRVRTYNELVEHVGQVLDVDAGLRAITGAPPHEEDGASGIHKI